MAGLAITNFMEHRILHPFTSTLASSIDLEFVRTEKLMTGPVGYQSGRKRTICDLTCARLFCLLSYQSACGWNGNFKGAKQPHTWLVRTRNGMFSAPSRMNVSSVVRHRTLSLSDCWSMVSYWITFWSTLFWLAICLPSTWACNFALYE